MRRVYKIFIILMLLIIPSKVYGLNKSNNYTIYSYHVDIVVNKDNTFDITEYIKANFNSYSHGIYRKIPLKNKVVRLDGNKTNNKARVKDVKTNVDFTHTISNNNYILELGSEDDELIGMQEYIIKYNYNIGPDPLKNKDELYFNIISDSWDTTVSNITFKITMPEDFDSSTLGFSSGKYGNIEDDSIQYLVGENTITGMYMGTLDEQESFTVRLELPEGYFTNASLGDLSLDKYYIIPLIFLIISIIMWYKYAKNRTKVDTSNALEIYPLKEYNPLDFAFFSGSYIQRSTVTSLLHYLANLGYLEIIEIEEKNDFIIRKLKDYNGSDENEKLFFDNIFKNDKTEVTFQVLNHRSSKTIKEIIKTVNSKKNKERIYEKNTINKNILLLIFCFITVLIVNYIPISNSYEVQGCLISGFLSSASIILIIGSGNLKNFKFDTIIFDLIIYIVFSIPMFFFLGEFFYDIKYIIGYIYGLGVANIIVLIAKCFPVRNKFGNEMLLKTSGFENFIKNATKEQLDEIIKENPNYLNDILPYLYVLRNFDILEKYPDITFSIPKWRKTTDEFI